MNRLSHSIMLQVGTTAVMLGLCGAALAQDRMVDGDTLLIERVQEKPANLPSRGMSMAQVEARFGAPSDRLDPRGGQKQEWPTINRWMYPAFTVYFERTKVHQCRDEQGRPERDRPEATHSLKPMTERSVRFPAEWEPQAAVLIAWPNAETDWAERLAEVEETYIALVTAITRFQRVVICVADDDVETYAEMRLRSNRDRHGRVRFVTVAYDDTWLRDSGPITLATPYAASDCWISASPAGAASSMQPTTTD